MPPKERFLLISFEASNPYLFVLAPLIPTREYLASSNKSKLDIVLSPMLTSLRLLFPADKEVVN